jgi:hypothetical protein
MDVEMDTEMKAEMESGDGKQRFGPRSLFPRTSTLQTATLSCCLARNMARIGDGKMALDRWIASPTVTLVLERRHEARLQPSTVFIPSSFT